MLIARTSTVKLSDRKIKKKTKEENLYISFIYTIYIKIDWLNKYNKRIRDVMGPEIVSQGRSDVHAYMMSQTEPFSKNTPSSAPRLLRHNVFMVVVLVLFTSSMMTRK